MKKGVKLLIIIGILFALVAPILFTQGWTNIDFTNTGQIGDTIGGTTAPIIGVLSVLLLFYTLWEQIRFNKKQKEISIDEQFKSTFFNLLQVQRDILDKISGKFSHLGFYAYEEYPQNDKDIKVQKEDKEWITIKNAKEVDDKTRGLDFFKEAKYQLHLIYEALDNEVFGNRYDSEDAYVAETEIREGMFFGHNIPPEIEREQDEKIAKMRKSFRVAYTADKYRISKQIHEKYKNLPQNKKIGLGYAYFFNKYENVGYYFRHIYRILKFIKMNEDEKISNLGKKAVENEKKAIHEQFKQYAQFIQAQMSIDELLLLF